MFFILIFQLLSILIISPFAFVFFYLSLHEFLVYNFFIAAIFSLYLFPSFNSFLESSSLFPFFLCIPHPFFYHAFNVFFFCFHLFILFPFISVSPSCRSLSLIPTSLNLSSSVLSISHIHYRRPHARVIFGHKVDFCGR